ncbi:hypothetical protein WHT83_06960 [Aminobacter sp. P9b]|uniref:Uncharacterized protein n=2 Tax=Phyllobacteriaceae TaxID=69277 RepID=A0ABR6L2Q8_9HYPH|nr:hypothetical protein [Aminobacter sp. MSH1]MBB4651078.1 hypothetical protein [Aminobacter niigataensis]
MQAIVGLRRGSRLPMAAAARQGLKYPGIAAVEYFSPRAGARAKAIASHLDARECISSAAQQWRLEMTGIPETLAS